MKNAVLDVCIVAVFIGAAACYILGAHLPGRPERDVTPARTVHVPGGAGLSILTPPETPPAAMDLRA